MKIIDVSKWQNKIDWKTVKAKNPDITGVFIKATEGVGYTDPFAKTNAQAAAKAGLSIGFYHFASLNTLQVEKDAQAEAQAFVKVVSSFGVTLSLPLVLDIERNDSGLSKEKVLEWVKAFFSELQKLGFQDVALYSYTPFLNQNLPEGHGLGALKLWLASYTLKPAIPKGWVGYWLWQYTSKGTVEGIKGGVDLNKF